MAKDKKSDGSGKRGNVQLAKNEPLSNPETIHCLRCNEEIKSGDLYTSRSSLFHGIGKVPYCKKCLDEMYAEYVKTYIVMNHSAPDRMAMERICMITDKYYSDAMFDSVVKTRAESDRYKDWTLVQLYMKHMNMYQYAIKSYDNTIADDYASGESMDRKAKKFIDFDSKTDSEKKIIKDAIGIFGKGFEEDDYLYLYDQYKDWTTRHECNTKAQEEVFKRLCFIQLDLLKAARKGSPTEKLDETFRKLLDTGNLQPKQNSKDSISDAQTLGTLIDKWENTRPLPEIDEELRDVDKIGLYIDVFFRGHLAKMANIKNAYSNLYDKFMEPYTVRKPEYIGDESNEALFEAMFGSSSLDDNEPDYNQDDDYNEGVVR